MSVRTNIREINTIRDQLSKKNAEYFDEVIVHIRSSRVQENSGEEWLLARGQELLSAQKQGKSASKLFGEDPVAFASEALLHLPQRKVSGRARLSVLVPWTALSWTFLLLGLTALIVPEAEETNTGMLLVVVIGAFALIEVLMRLTRRDPEEGIPAPPKFNLRGIGTVLIALVILGTASLMLLRITPVITIPYWVSLILAGVGFVGQVLLFRRR
ncbi:DUF1129 family protein [Saccharibacillus kuerlensis]|uniref:DUF1129 family protein n=1 Tax=Saccharibacillus kuerlensis TaxID=459527 RepID=A0ABQ2L8J6_9BACL|nr:DUF1129 family protein [Saccharibacillus kuerlensis]GGO06721.1 hypothetical protein GCM10010969_34590 [Saccharibacillus kuerlensis]